MVNASERVGELLQRFGREMQAEGIGIEDATMLTVAFAAHVAAVSVCQLCDPRERDAATEHIIRVFAAHARRRSSEGAVVH